MSDTQAAASYLNYLEKLFQEQDGNDIVQNPSAVYEKLRNRQNSVAKAQEKSKNDQDLGERIPNKFELEMRHLMIVE